MRWVKFTEIQMREAEPGKLAIRPVPRMINVELVGTVAPAMVPSEIVGPDNSPTAKPASVITVQGEQILVESTLSETLYKLTWEGISVEGPEGLEENEFQVTETIKRPVPKVEPDVESTIIQ